MSKSHFKVLLALLAWCHELHVAEVLWGRGALGIEKSTVILIYPRSVCGGHLINSKHSLSLLLIREGRGRRNGKDWAWNGKWLEDEGLGRNWDEERMGNEDEQGRMGKDVEGSGIEVGLGREERQGCGWSYQLWMQLVLFKLLNKQYRDRIEVCCGGRMTTNIILTTDKQPWRLLHRL